MPKRRRKTAQDRADERRRMRDLKRIERAIADRLSLALKDKIRRIEAISDATWNAAVDGESPEELKETDIAERREWPPLVEQLSNVGRLVHLAARMDPIDEEQIRTELLRARRDAYESELEIQAGLVGCLGQRARLTSGPSLTTLNDMSQRDAVSIVNTYNYDLAVRIAAIQQEAPTANRHVYAYRLRSWFGERNKQKKPVIAMYTANTARTLAQQDFYQFNRALMGTAHLEPLDAVCPVCIGWVKRGEVPMQVALNNASPFHNLCPHLWVTNPVRVPKDECPNLWMGG